MVIIVACYIQFASAFLLRFRIMADLIRYTIELPQTPFCLVPKVLYAIDLQAFGIESFMVMVDCFVLVSLHG